LKFPVGWGGGEGGGTNKFKEMCDA